MKPKECPFYVNCIAKEMGLLEDIPTADIIQHCKNWIQCQYYSWQKYLNTIPLPLICPRFFECGHQTKHTVCQFERDRSDDYRSCEYFSRWFWETKAGQK